MPPRRWNANQSSDTYQNEDEQEVNMPRIVEITSHELHFDPVISQIQTTTVQSSPRQRTNDGELQFGLPIGFVAPPQITFSAPAMTSEHVNPITSRNVDVRSNISRTSNSGFLGNFPYGYTDNSSLSNITNTTLQSLRQQIDDSNHEMVNMMTQQMATVFNPVIENSNAAYQALATRMSQIAEMLGVP
ncbi:myb-related transcription factor, partial [Trifolium medium]|nr:myb-related transcription factor [Trifolium medium]